MTTVARAVFLQHFEAAGSRSPPEGEPGVALARKERWSETQVDAFSEALARGGRELGPGEARALQHVRRILSSPDLFAVIPSRLEELRAVSRGRIPKRERKSGRRQAVPAFSSHIAPRIAQSAPSEAVHAPWITSTAQTVFGIPALSPDGEQLYALGSGGTLFALGREDGVLQWSLSLGQRANSTPALTRDGRTLFAVTGKGQAELHAVDTQTRSLRWKASAGTKLSTDPWCSPVLSPDERHVFVSALSGDLVKYDAQSGEEVLRIFVGEGNAVFSFSPNFSPDGRTVFVRDGCRLCAFDTETGEERWQAPVSGMTHASPVLSPDGTTVYVPGNAVLHAFDAESGLERWASNIRGCAGTPTPVVSADGTRVYMPSGDGQLHVLDAEDGTSLQQLRSGKGTALQAIPALSADGKRAYACDTYGGITEFDLERETSRHIQGSCYTYGGFVLSPDGRFAYLGSSNTQVLIALQLVD